MVLHEARCGSPLTTLLKTLLARCLLQIKAQPCSLPEDGLGAECRLPDHGQVLMLLPDAAWQSEP